MYQYYVAVEEEINEHMLYPSEIAILYGLIKYDKPQYLSVTHAITKYCKDNSIEYRPFYYNTRNGLRKVYPAAIYVPAMESYLKGEW